MSSVPKAFPPKVTSMLLFITDEDCDKLPLDLSTEETALCSVVEAQPRQTKVVNDLARYADILVIGHRNTEKREREALVTGIITALEATRFGVRLLLWVRDEDGEHSSGSCADSGPITYVASLVEAATKCREWLLQFHRSPALPQREGGERCIPLPIWAHPTTQRWVQQQKTNGNRIDGADVKMSFFAGPRKAVPFLFALHVNVFVAAENRSKSNELVVFRSDISTIVLYHLDETLLATKNVTVEDILTAEVVLIKEFRSPVRNELGFVVEPPGGSSWEEGVQSAEEIAAEEVAEETGLHIDVSRLHRVGTRQLAATLSAHQASVFVARLNADELAKMKLAEREQTVSGVEHDSERTTILVVSVKEIIEQQSPKAKAVDFSSVGMILQAVLASARS